MQVVSSQWTLAFKLLIPTFWFSFFGGLTVIMLFIDLSDIGEPFSPFSARMMMLSFLLSTFGIYYLLFFKIKWVALDEETLYVSNFRHSYKYTFDSIERIEETKVLFWNKITIHFNKAGKFGKSIVFYASYYWYYYLKEHPKVLEELLPKVSKDK